MKKYKSLLFIFVLLLFALFTNTSCSGSKNIFRNQGQALSPITPKDSPLPKKYIIRNKRNRILGNERPNL